MPCPELRLREPFQLQLIVGRIRLELRQRIRRHLELINGFRLPLTLPKLQSDTVLGDFVYGSGRVCGDLGPVLRSAGGATCGSLTTDQPIIIWLFLFSTAFS